MRKDGGEVEPQIQGNVTYFGERGRQRIRVPEVLRSAAKGLGIGLVIASAISTKYLIERTFFGDPMPAFSPELVVSSYHVVLGTIGATLGVVLHRDSRRSLLSR